MSENGVFVDHPFLTVAAHHLGHDIVILPVHEETVANKSFELVYGGPILEEKSGPNCPIFLGMPKLPRDYSGV